MTGREGAAILAFFGVEPKKVACLTGSSIADAHRQGFSDRTQVEPQVELREIALPAERRARRLHADFFGWSPKKSPFFSAPKKPKKCAEIGQGRKIAGRPIP